MGARVAKLAALMSDAIAFDTHRSVKRLMEGGFEERQAEEQIAFLNANLATKADIARVKSGLVRWMFGAIFGALFAYTTIPVPVALFGFFVELPAS